MTGPTVVATLLVHDNAGGAAHVVRRLVAQTRRPDALVVVDNGSATPFDPSGLDSGGLDIQLVRIENNAGVGHGHNRGVRRAIGMGATHVWMLEHDTFPDRDCLERLLGRRSRLDAPCIVVPSLVRNNYERRWLTKADDAVVSETFTWNGPLVDAAVFDVVGWLREDLFVGQEDVEFALRMSACDVAAWHEPGAVAVHPNKGMHRFSSYEAPDRVYYSVRNELAVRPSSGVTRVRLRCTALVKSLGELARPGRGPRFAWARWQGTCDGLARRLGPRSATRFAPSALGRAARRHELGDTA